MSVDVAAIWAALEAATPGPWTLAEDDGTSIYSADGESWPVQSGDDWGIEREADAELIVLLRNNAEALLRMLDDGYCAGYDHGVEDQMDRQEAALADAERRGAVKALRAAADELSDSYRYSDDGEDWDRSGLVESRADAIEKGGDF